jgi:succinate dehydrogenase / fumarate reductase, flavoprotein subunit
LAESIDKLGEVIATDVLVIGGGMSGLLAGIKASSAVNDVLVVDKGGIGWAGQVPLSGGDCALIRPEEAEAHFKWLVVIGDYLNNQEWTYAFAHDMHGCLREAAGMGLPFWVADGELVAMPFHKKYRATHFSPAKIMIKLKQAATKKRIKTLDKLFVADLIRKDDKVIGAVGFGLVDGKTYIIKARATVIANGSCRYYAQRHFSVNTGEGVAMAYRAGAHLMNAEFSNTYTFGFKGDIRRRTPLYLFFENVLGERFVERYYPEVKTGPKSGQEFLDFYRIADAMTKEVEAGRGPIYIDFRKLTDEEKSLALQSETLPVAYQPAGRGELLKAIRDKLRLDPDRERIEVELQFVGGQGPIRIDLECRTTVGGLWAVGDAGSLGSGYTGARASGTFGGFGVAFATVSGLKGGQSAGTCAATTGPLTADYGDVKKLRDSMLSPLGRRGEVDVNDVIYGIHEAMIPVKYNLHRKDSRLREALGKIDAAESSLVRVGARDHHELARYHQAESMALSAGWTLKSALMREESRGTHHREDYPGRDDKNWLKWIVIKEEEGRAKFFTEPVPLEEYRLNPLQREQ